MTAYEIRKAAIALFVEVLGGRIGHPYKLEWQQHGNSLFVYGPDPALNWLEDGLPICPKYQITVVVFRDHTAILHIYNRYQQALGSKSLAEFEYNDPKYPDNLIGWVVEIVDRHSLLREVERDEYNDFIREQRRKGGSIPYISHLLAVAALVMEDGGDEDEQDAERNPELPLPHEVDASAWLE